MTIRLYIILALVILYFLPTWFGLRRNKASIRLIFLLNLLFGWTCVAWYYAFLLGYRGDEDWRRVEKKRQMMRRKTIPHLP